MVKEDKGRQVAEQSNMNSPVRSANVPGARLQRHSGATPQNPIPKSDQLMFPKTPKEQEVA